MNLLQEQVLERKMNQSLLQSLQLLQYSSFDLMEYIKEIEKENPLIGEVIYQDDVSYFHPSRGGLVAPIELNVKELTMYEKLKKQLYMLTIPKEIHHAVLYGIDSLNESGYLEIDLEFWANACDITLQSAEKALLYIQSLEPTGIGARSLSECIYLQLAQDAPDPDLLQDLLGDNLNWVAAGDVLSISKYYSLSEPEVEGLLAKVRRCDPKPGKRITTKTTNYITPEASIYKQQGKWHVSFFSWSSPSIKIDPNYKEFVSDEKYVVRYLNNKWSQVESLRKAISYRHNTLERVIHCIIEKQSPFFENGLSMLQPLTLKEIADVLELHTSTISRTVSNKYIQTASGVFPLNFFLQSGIQQADGTKTSSIVVKQQIADLVKNEDKRKPLSDREIKGKLEAVYGLHIARRTVMKYREHQEIPSSSKRKET
ncbi:RNA polymerase sigma factor [Oceanobacillus picturae]|uniref:RNA polymerase sigma factor n=1 Tax=Oceanobacillus picturae TaxID=171693 RepID=A0A0U9H950_9BACI|nr:RNA polymerase factor sigma-54 [Oceanobacillus picturae]GAQ18544.1 RNA polymerase sigma factor [Oceanobacillus picturae]